MFVNETKFVEVLRIYIYLNEIYESIVTGLLIFGNKMTNVFIL